MNWNWLWLLWPMVGLLGWAWFNHMLLQALGPVPEGIDARMRKGLNVLYTAAIVIGVIAGPFALLVTLIEMRRYPPKCRRGLKFWW